MLADLESFYDIWRMRVARCKLEHIFGLWWQVHGTRQPPTSLNGNKVPGLERCVGSEHEGGLAVSQFDGGGPHWPRPKANRNKEGAAQQEC